MAMAQEMARLYRETTLESVRVLAMAGHEDGIITFGHTAEEAGAAEEETALQAESASDDAESTAESDAEPEAREPRVSISSE